MQDLHKKQFWTLVNVAMELTNHPPLSKEAIVTWWSFLSKYEYEEVETALDKWVKEMAKPPTPSDILKLCQHKVTIHARLASPLTKQANAEYAKEVVDYVKENAKPKRDMKEWARKIIANQKAYPQIAVKFAMQALNMEEV